MVLGSGRTWPHDLRFFVGFLSDSAFSVPSSASILMSGCGEARSEGVTVSRSKSVEARRAIGSEIMVADSAGDGDDGVGLL